MTVIAIAIDREIPAGIANCHARWSLSRSLWAACEKEAVETVQHVRSVKTIVVSDMASAQVRKFPGTIEPVDSSKISFEVDGVIQNMRVDVGDTFKKGDVLAVLDKKPFELNVESARATSVPGRSAARGEEERL